MKLECSLDLLEERHLPLMLEWRNSDRVRKNMLNDKIITFDEHQNWFKRMSQTGTNYYFIFSINEKPTGVVCFYDIDHPNMISNWGAYIGDANAPKGSGTAMGYLGLSYAFETLKIRKISSERLATNTISTKYTNKFGAKEEGVFKKHLLRDGVYIDIIRIGLFREDWLKQKDTLKETLMAQGFHFN